MMQSNEIDNSYIYECGIKKINLKKLTAAQLIRKAYYEEDDERYMLMNDDDFDTRNWATFSLAHICESDTPTIRDALYKNLK